MAGGGIVVLFHCFFAATSIFDVRTAGNGVVVFLHYCIKVLLLF